MIIFRLTHLFTTVYGQSTFAHGWIMTDKIPRQEYTYTYVHARATGAHPTNPGNLFGLDFFRLVRPHIYVHVSCLDNQKLSCYGLFS